MPIVAKLDTVMNGLKEEIRKVALISGDDVGTRHNLDTPALMHVIQLDEKIVTKGLVYSANDSQKMVDVINTALRANGFKSMRVGEDRPVAYVELIPKDPDHSIGGFKYRITSNCLHELSKSWNVISNVGRKEAKLADVERWDAGRNKKNRSDLENKLEEAMGKFLPLIISSHITIKDAIFTPDVQFRFSIDEAVLSVKHASIEDRGRMVAAINKGFEALGFANKDPAMGQETAAVQYYIPKGREAARRSPSLVLTTSNLADVRARWDDITAKSMEAVRAIKLQSDSRVLG